MTILVWPHAVLVPSAIMVNPVPFSRSGGVSLGGLERSTRTDRGWWAIDFKAVSLYTVAQRRMWNALRITLCGTAGQVAVPAWSFDTAPWLPGTNGYVLSTHSDGTTFSDDSEYSQPQSVVEMAVAAALGDTAVTLRIVGGIDELTGTRFSYNHALYELGIPTVVDGDEWTMPVFPAIRAPIPADALLNFTLPTCLVKLATDRAMDVSLTAGNFDRADVSFVEAVEFWNSLALVA
jgi:hypothetical protein